MKAHRWCAAVTLLALALPVFAGCGGGEPSVVPVPLVVPAIVPTTSGADAAEPSTNAESEAAAASGVIRIPLHDWSSQLVSAEVVGGILTEAGFSVEYVPFDSQEVYQAMCDGNIDLVQEVWEPAFGIAFQEQLDKGCILDWATHDAVTREEWWYPSYVEEQCPGLPDWEALRGCASVFATEETGDKGRYLAGLADWEYGDRERVEALDLDFQVVHVTSATQLWIELEAASADETPIVLLNWTPNFVEAVYDGSFVEFPAFEDACITDPAWGMNTDLTHDCGGPADGYLKTAVSAQFPGKSPAAALIVGRINFTNAMLAEMAAEVDVRGKTASAAARDWLGAFEDLWRGWVSG
jgi:glycine betaine/proline transport system substrate-binding protein